MEYKFSGRVSNLRPSAIREILKVTQDPSVISFAAGSPAPETFPREEMEKLAAELFQKQAASALQYGTTEGYTPLRELTSKRVREKYGVGSEKDDILITTGGQQAVELTAKVLVNEGDTVVCEDPSFLGALNAFRSFGAKLTGCPSDGDGMRMDKLEEILKADKRVKLIYVIPTFQNPTGRTMSLARRKRLLELAEEYDTVILEDNPYFELRYSGQAVPPVKSMDTNGRVVYAGSYSKVLSPGIRIGYAIAPHEIFSKLVVCKQVGDVHTNLFFQMLVANYLQRYDLDAHIEKIRRLYHQKRDLMLEACKKYFLPNVTVTRPDGGLFIWGELPQGYDGMELCRIAGFRKVAAVPGASFQTDEDRLCGGFRMNFSLASAEQIDTGIRILGEAIAEYLNK